MNTISSMLGKSILRLCLLSMLWVGLAAMLGFHSVKLHACTPMIGYGNNVKCQQGDSCGEICGTTSAWCITETCSLNACGGSTENIECVTGGCLNKVQGNCSSCPGS
jgi:hypothetical protein